MHVMCFVVLIHCLVLCPGLARMGLCFKWLVLVNNTAEWDHLHMWEVMKIY